MIQYLKYDHHQYSVISNELNQYRILDSKTVQIYNIKINRTLFLLTSSKEMPLLDNWFNPSIWNSQVDEGISSGFVE